MVVVGSNPLQPQEDAEKLVKSVKQMSEYKKVAPLRELLRKVRGHISKREEDGADSVLGAHASQQRSAKSHRNLQAPAATGGVAEGR